MEDKRCPECNNVLEKKRIKKFIEVLYCRNCGNQFLENGGDFKKVTICA